MIAARFGTDEHLARVAPEPMLTQAHAVNALTVIGAVVGTQLGRTVLSGPSLIAGADLSGVVAFAVSRAVLGTDFYLARRASKSCLALARVGTDALSMKRARIGACANLATGTRASDFAETGAVGQALATTAVMRARLVRARHSGPHLSVERGRLLDGTALARLAVLTTSVARALLWTELDGAVTALEAGVAFTLAPGSALSVETARVRARRDLARGPRKAFATLALAALGALTVVGAVVRTFPSVTSAAGPHLTLEGSLTLGNRTARALLSLRIARTVHDVPNAAIVASISVVALAFSVVAALPVIPAHVRASGELTSVACPPLLAGAHAVLAHTVVGAVLEASVLSTILSGELRKTLRLPVFDDTVIFDDVSRLATLTLPAGGTDACAVVIAGSAAAARERTGSSRAVNSLKALVTQANTLFAFAVIVAVRHGGVVAAEDLSAAWTSVSRLHRRRPGFRYVALTNPVRTRSPAVAVVGTPTERAAFASPSVLALAASAAVADAVAGASLVTLRPSVGLRTLHICTVHSPMALFTHACPVIALSESGAVVGTGLGRARVSRPRIFAMALVICAHAVSVAVVRTHHLLT